VSAYDYEYESKPCYRCGGDGVDPDQSKATYLHQINGDPVTCDECNGRGVIFTPIDDL
jgi:DnaJ-class molecular chaperone